ncbi:AraC family transcriptional regulator [Methylopila sp. 73B]|uniref:helix-turn-helix transcriptional regulator n=1 Tax=Methylopila sp. 73B TaxID=1120792 RepID=UPI0003788889|nr:AraC family transcriptional regulator [Methylopila sp. 73B]
MRYANGGLQGELSSPPDRVSRFLSDVDGVSLVDYAYDAGGAATRTVFGLHVGVFEPRPGVSLTFAGDGAPAVHTSDGFVLHGPGQVSRILWDGAYRARSVSVSPDAAERMFQKRLSELAVAPTIGALEDRPQIRRLFAALCDDASETESADPLFLASVALAILRAAGVTATSKRRKPASLTPAQARLMRELVASRLTEPLTLRAMAEAIGLSESYFVRAFRGAFGVTPYRYILRERLARAQALIQDGEATLAEVARLSGFPDAGAMGRTFRRLIGRSPTGAVKTRRRPVGRPASGAGLAVQEADHR